MAAALLAASFAALSPQIALGHSGYESSKPADGEVLAESPPSVEVTFGQEMARNQGLPTMIVVNDAGDVIADEAALSDDDRTLLTLELPAEMANGRYTVIWHTLSDEDGEEANGAFHFYVGEGPDAQPTDVPGSETPTPVATEPPSEAGEDEDGVPLWALIAGVIGGVVAGGGAGMTLARRRSA